MSVTLLTTHRSRRKWTHFSPWALLCISKKESVRSVTYFSVSTDNLFWFFLWSLGRHPLYSKAKQAKYPKRKKTLRPEMFVKKHIDSLFQRVCSAASPNLCSAASPKVSWWTRLWLPGFASACQSSTPSPPGSFWGGRALWTASHIRPVAAGSSPLWVQMSGPGPGLGWQGLAGTAGSGPSGSSAHPEEPGQSSEDATDKQQAHRHSLVFLWLFTGL